MDTKRLRQKILDLAIHGKLVPQNPDDEPASKLLERIQKEKKQHAKDGKIKKSADSFPYENIPFEIPDSWCWTYLGNITNYGTCTTIDVSILHNDTWILELEDIEKDTAHIIQHLCKGQRSIKGVRHEFKKGDVLYSKLRTYLNKVLVAPEDGYCTTEIIPIVPLMEVYSEFLSHVLRSPYFLDYTAQCGYGVKMPRLSTSDARKGLIPIPPLAEQKRIVAAIDSWFALFDELENGKIALQAAIKQAQTKILDLAIHGKLVPQDVNDEPASALLKSLGISSKNSHHEDAPFAIPEGWCWSKLGDIGTWQAGGTPDRLHKEYYGGDIPWLKTGDLNDDLITDIPEHITQVGLDNSSAKLNPKDSVLIAMYGATIGKLGILTFPATTNQACCACIDYKAVTRDYLFYFLMSHKDEFIRRGGGGAQPNISKDIILKTLIPVPPMKEQIRIVEKIKELQSQLGQIQDQL